MTAGTQRGALLALLLLCACRPASGADDGAARADALEATQALDARLEQVVDDVATLKSERTVVGEEIETLTTRITALHRELKASVRELRSATAVAEGSAADALSRLDSLSASLENLRLELSVLTERYDFHLKRYHAGGAP